MNPTGNLEDIASIPGLELGCSWQMWLGSCFAVAVVSATATAWIQPLAWERPYAVSAALKKQKREKKRKEEKRKEKKRKEKKTLALGWSPLHDTRCSSLADFPLSVFSLCYFTGSKSKNQAGVKQEKVNSMHKEQKKQF